MLTWHPEGGLFRAPRLLYEKRFSLFHYPVSGSDAPEYLSAVSSPMDVATLLQRVDEGLYLSRPMFLSDVELIPANAKVGDGVGRRMGGGVGGQECEIFCGVVWWGAAGV